MDTEELIRRVASHLSGVPVVVRFREPAVQGASGQVYQASGGVVVVDVNPNLNQNDRWKVFLHEIAHLHLKHYQLTSTSHQAGSGSVERKQADREGWNQSEPEQQAEHLAEQWNQYAMKRGNFHLNRNLSLSPVQAMLKALLEWTKEG
jgi:hypothetical protein